MAFSQSSQDVFSEDCYFNVSRARVDCEGIFPLVVNTRIEIDVVIFEQSKSGE